MFGTALVMVSLNWSTQTSDPAASIAITVFIVTLMIAPVSGAHLNPAITIAVLIQ